MKLYVADASVAVKWFIPEVADETHVDQALQLLAAGQRQEARLLQPPHWVSEVSAVLVRRAPATVSEAVGALLELEFVKIAYHARYYQRAITLALQFNHHLFDTFYHAIALEENATLITADRRYYDKARNLGSIAMLENFSG
jgi:predicted nucleic acid-binding protein